MKHRHKREGPMCGELLHLVHRHWLTLHLCASPLRQPGGGAFILGVSADVPPEKDPGLDAWEMRVDRVCLAPWEDQTEAGKTDGKRGR